MAISNGTITTNHGSSTVDAVACGAKSQTQYEWLQEHGVDKDSRVKLVKASHMRYQHPELEKITIFLRDFGMKVVKSTETQRWFGGYGPDQYIYYAQAGPKKFLGGTFEVESYEELEKITNLTGVTCISNGIQKMNDAPGGGCIVSIEDPEGFPVNFIFGQAPKDTAEAMPEKLIVNYENEKQRLGKFQRFQPGPAGAFKLGHFGYSVDDCEAQIAFYTRNFNIVPSDILHLPVEVTGGKEGVVGAMFGHIDRGLQFVDHHTLFLVGHPPHLTKHIHHSSYEVHDFDTQALGHQYLSQKGYELAWGIGRHVLGSQIFDYWWDTTGFMVEHYADGDLVNENTPVGFGPAGSEGLAVWGPEVPASFLE